MNIRRLWILVGIIATILILAIGGILIGNYQKGLIEKRDQTAALEVSRNFSQAWFNYTTQTDPAYLNKLKPLMTPNFYDATKYINTERPQDFEGQLPMTSKVLSAEIQGYSNSKTSVKVQLETKERGKPKDNLDILVVLTKVNNNWIVNSFE